MSKLYIYAYDMANDATNMTITDNCVVIANSLVEARNMFLKKHSWKIKFWEVDNNRWFDSLEEEERKQMIISMFLDDEIFEIEPSKIEGIQSLRA